MSTRRGNSGIRYRFATSAAFGVLVMVLLGIVTNENVRHHTGHAMTVTNTAYAGAVAAVLMFVVWSAIAAFRGVGKRAAERAREAERAERERLSRTRGRRYRAGAR